MKALSCTILILFCTIGAYGQVIDDLDRRAEIVNLQTRQIRQFFDRFNFNEAVPIPNTSPIKFASSRELNLAGLFDWNLIGQDRPTAKRFIAEVCKQAVYLDYLDDNWFVEAIGTGTMGSYKIPLHFVMRYTRYPEGGSAWEIVSIFSPHFDRPQAEQNGKIHAHENEMSFMRFPEKVNASEIRSGLFAEDVSRSQTQLILFLMNQEILTVLDIDQVDYHFLQIPGWAFQVQKIRKQSWNGGWRITVLSPLPIDEVEAYTRDSLYFN